MGPRPVEQWVLKTMALNAPLFLRLQSCAFSTRGKYCGFKSLTWKVERVDRSNAFMGLKHMGNVRFLSFVQPTKC